MNRVSSNFYFAPSSIQTNYLSSGQLSAFSTTNFSLSTEGLTNLVLSLSNVQENFDRYQKVIVDWDQGNENYEVTINPTITQSISSLILQNIFTTSSANDPNTFSVSLSLFRLPFDTIFDTINIDLNIFQPSFTDEYNIKLLKNYNYFDPDTKINNLVLFIEQQNNNGISIVYNEIPNNLTNFVDSRISAAEINFVGDSIGEVPEYYLSACDCNGLIQINRASDGVGPAMAVVSVLLPYSSYTASNGTTYQPVSSFTYSALTETSKVINWATNVTGANYFSVPIYVPDIYVNDTQYFIVQLSNLFNTFVDPNSAIAYVLLDPYSACNIDMEPCGLAPIPSPSVTPSNTPTNTVTPTVTPTNTVTPTVTPTSSVTPTSTVTPTNTVAATATPAVTPTNTVTPTVTPTSSVTPTVTPTNTVTITPTLSPGSSPTATPTVTPTNTVTPTETPTSTVTPTVTPTITPTSSLTPTPTLTPGSSPTTTPTVTPTNTVTPTVTPTRTVTPTGTPGITPTKTPAPTTSPAVTPTNTVTATITPTNTVTATITPTPTPAVVSGNFLYALGLNDYGQLGNGSTSDITTTAQKIGSSSSWVDICTNSQSSIGVKSDNTLWVWGNNTAGQLGLGNYTQQNSPVQLGSLTTWASVPVNTGDGVSNLGAIKTNGTLWLWGNNTQGQLGTGDNNDSNVPVQVGSDTNWQSVSLGNTWTLALKTNGTLWAWGYGGYSSLGQGNTTSFNTPQQIGSDTTWAEIWTTSSGWIARKSNNTFWACGTNTYGELGTGNTTTYSTPTQITVGTVWKALSITNNGAFGYSAGIKTDGTLWAWGNIPSLSINSLTPVQIGSDTNWSKVQTTGYSNETIIAIKTTGTLWYDGGGWTGINTNVTSFTQIGVATTWTEINCNGDSLLLLATT